MEVLSKVKLKLERMVGGKPNRTFASIVEIVQPGVGGSIKLIARTNTGAFFQVDLPLFRD